MTYIILIVATIVNGQISLSPSTNFNTVQECIQMRDQMIAAYDGAGVVATASCRYDVPARLAD